MFTKIKQFFQRVWKWLTALFIGGVVIAQVVGFPPVEIPEDQRLKAPKTDIVMARGFVHVKKDKKKDPIPGTETQAIEYAYKTNKKIIPNVLDDNRIALEAGKRGLELRNELVNRRTSKNRIFATSDPKKFILEAISEPQYYKDPQGDWWQAEYATASLDYYNQQIADTPLEKLFAFFTKSAYAACSGTPTSPCTSFPDANPETATVDGSVTRSITCAGATESLATIRDGAGTSASPTTGAPGATNLMRVRSGDQTNAYCYYQKAIFGFDTSGIGAGSTVSAATFSLSGSGDPSSTGQTAIVNWVITSSAAPATATDLVAGDYTKPTTTAVSGTSTISSFNTTNGTYNDKTITNLTAISKTAVTWLAVQSEAMRSGTAEGTWVDSEPTSFDGYYAEATGTSTDPKLVVTFSAGGGGVIKQSEIFY